MRPLPCAGGYVHYRTQITVDSWLEKALQGQGGEEWSRHCPVWEEHTTPVNLTMSKIQGSGTPPFPEANGSFHMDPGDSFLGPIIHIVERMNE